MVETPEYKADASSVVGTMIGGRLDWIEFGTAAERLLPQLLAEPIPYPPNGMDGSPFHPQAETLQLEGELS
jgi:hypothetical protein